MLVVIIIIIMYVIALIFDFVPILKQHKKKEIVIYSVIMLLSFAIILFDKIGNALPKLSPAMESFARKFYQPSSS